LRPCEFGGYAGEIAAKGNRSERDLRHSVNTQAAYRAALRLASLPEDAMDLSTKLKITAVMAAVLRWSGPSRSPSEGGGPVASP
jgi:hypothetical protein